MRLLRTEPEFPASALDARVLPEGGLARFAISLADSLGLSAIRDHCEYRVGRKKRKARSGQPPFHPKMTTGLLLRARCVGAPSSRRIARLRERGAGFHAAAGGRLPDFRTIGELRRIHLKALEGLFVQAPKIAQGGGLAKPGRVALDRTKVKANASKHKAMGYGRMAKKGRVVCGKRKEIVEPVFGQMKQGRRLRRFLLRGLEKVQGEWSMRSAARNALKLRAATAVRGGESPYFRPSERPAFDIGPVPAPTPARPPLPKA